MLKVFSFLKPYRFLVWVALFLMFMELIVELVQPLLLAKIIDDGIMNQDLDMVLKWGGIMLAISFLAFFSGIINSYYAADVSQSMGYDIRNALYHKIQTFTFRSLERFATSSLITRMTNDVAQIQNTVFMGLRIMLRAPLVVIGGMIMIMTVHLKIGLIFMIIIPCLLVLLSWVLKKGKMLFTDVQKKLDQINHIMRENLVGIRLIKAFVRREHEGRRFVKGNKDLMLHTITALRLMEVTMPLLLLVMNAGIMAVLWFGHITIEAGGATVGEVVAIVNYATRITSAFTLFSMIVVVFSRARASAERITDVLETKNEPRTLTKSEHQVNQGSIKFQHVSFRYSSSEHDILNDISFNVNHGETVAIMGATGSGKSTLFQLIPRLYEVNQGEIFIDGQRIEAYEEKALRESIGYVPQETFLFSGTIKDNLSWGNEQASLEEMINATKDAQIHEMIERLPNQYDTKIGQKGVNLSGGQKQRLSIARALIRKPKILLLDDSTSALDVKTEAKFLESLQSYSCTTLIITQKLSTAMMADQIVLMDEGKIIAKGDHQTLLKESQLYLTLYQSQHRRGATLHA
ncbi:ABC transporter ATP-binding protein [Halalkalibacter urbisdiaboli]|uniref:ABC transporter ATP-binding protein n=1 Tax=Halalkalibacter urbisdiaboli TaxID=1960589 RepID=UPI000B43E492|nr:ABC transporter ATP-binding protein [Halalkalibacter urbisdiaboli]